MRKTVDPDNPWIVLRKPWIFRGSTPSCATLTIDGLSAQKRGSTVRKMETKKKPLRSRKNWEESLASLSLAAIVFLGLWECNSHVKQLCVQPPLSKRRPTGSR